MHERDYLVIGIKHLLTLQTVVTFMVTIFPALGKEEIYDGQFNPGCYRQKRYDTPDNVRWWNLISQAHLLSVKTIDIIFVKTCFTLKKTFAVFSIVGVKGDYAYRQQSILLEIFTRDSNYFITGRVAVASRTCCWCNSSPFRFRLVHHQPIASSSPQQTVLSTSFAPPATGIPDV